MIYLINITNIDKICNLVGQIHYISVQTHWLWSTGRYKCVSELAISNWDFSGKFWLALSTFSDQSENIPFSTDIWHCSNIYWPKLIEFSVFLRPQHVPYLLRVTKCVIKPFDYFALVSICVWPCAKRFKNVFFNTQNIIILSLNIVMHYIVIMFLMSS